jgi:hypothetical protein
MPALPWKSLGTAEPNREYLVMGSRLPLRSYWRIPEFLRLTLAVRRQLAQSDGLVGYALNAQLGRKTFWTVSAWRDQAALDAFARTMPHADIMRRLRPHMMPTTFRTWAVPGASLPVPWPETEARLRQEE